MDVHYLWQIYWFLSTCSSQHVLNENVLISDFSHPQMSSKFSVWLGILDMFSDRIEFFFWNFFTYFWCIFKIFASPFPSPKGCRRMNKCLTITLVFAKYNLFESISTRGGHIDKFFQTYQNTSKMSLILRLWNFIPSAILRKLHVCDNPVWRISLASFVALWFSKSL